MIRYIQRQKEHHKSTGFRGEYESLLKEFGVDAKSDRLLDD